MELSQASAAFQKTMQGYSGFWCVAGGWAIDLYLGKVTRVHEDLEIVVLREEHAAIFAHFKKFRAQKIIVAGEEPTFELYKGGPIEPEVIQLRLEPFRTPDRIIEFDLLLTPSDGDNWICRRDESIRRPVKEIFGVTPSGVPYLAPEISLLFKAKYVREKDAADFEQTVGSLQPNAKAWLRESLERVHPKHLWLSRL